MRESRGGSRETRSVLETPGHSLGARAACFPDIRPPGRTKGRENGAARHFGAEHMGAQVHGRESDGTTGFDLPRRETALGSDHDLNVASAPIEALHQLQKRTALCVECTDEPQLPFSWHELGKPVGKRARPDDFRELSSPALPRHLLRNPQQTAPARLPLPLRNRALRRAEQEALCSEGRDVPDGLFRLVLLGHGCPETDGHLKGRRRSRRFYSDQHDRELICFQDRFRLESSARIEEQESVSDPLAMDLRDVARGLARELDWTRAEFRQGHTQQGIAARSRRLTHWAPAQGRGP